MSSRDTGQFIDLTAEIAAELLEYISALRPLLLQYITDTGPNRDENRKTFTKYVAETVYFPD